MTLYGAFPIDDVLACLARSGTRGVHAIDRIFAACNIHSRESGTNLRLYANFFTRACPWNYERRNREQHRSTGRRRDTSIRQIIIR